MRLKTLVMLSSFLVLGSFIVCVSVYAYNAYATKNVNLGSVALSGNSNNSNLDDGYMTAYARVGTDSHLKNEFYDGEDISLSVLKSGSVSLSGYASGYVYGYDSNGSFQSKFDDRVHEADPDY